MKNTNVFFLPVIAAMGGLLLSPHLMATPQGNAQFNQSKPPQESRQRENGSSNGNKEKPQQVQQSQQKDRSPAANQPYTKVQRIPTNQNDAAKGDRWSKSDNRSRDDQGSKNNQASNGRDTNKKNWDKKDSDKRDSDRRHSNNRDWDRKKYNRDNHYGGRWYPADTHRDWDRNRHYHWNNHQYRWYDGGWLIIDTGYNPFYASYDDRPIEEQVQIELADQGYYAGPIDGDIGPGSSRAIARYQADHGLRITGQINNSLIASLGL